MLKNNLSMRIPFRGNSWLLYSFLFVGITLQLWPGPASAAKLLDVRVGEYDGFTRIVFEVDTPAAQPSIKIQAPNRLWIAFDRTDAELGRKIPVKRSRHISSLKFWQQNDTLSAVLTFDYAYIRFESFSLNSPPRIAVDIFPTDSPPVITKDQPAVTETSEPRQPAIPSEKNAPPELSDQDNAEQQQPEQPQVDVGRAENADTATEKAVPALPKLVTPPNQRDEVAPPEQKNAPTQFRLQFFLVIGLVVITIGILFLLLLMLFARHRFSEVKSKLNNSDFLRQQDKKIAALDSRIKEQFERYDEA